MTPPRLTTILLLALCSFVSLTPARAQDPTPATPASTPSIAPNDTPNGTPGSTHRRSLPRPLPTPEPEKLRPPFNTTFGELSGFGYDPEDRAFYFSYEGERYWFHIGKIDPDSKPETGLLFLQQIRESKAIRIKAFADPVNGYVVVKNIVLYY